VAPNPDEFRLCVGTLAVLNPGDDGLDDVPIVDRLASRRFPAISAPVLEPFSNTTDGVFAVTVDLDVDVDWSDVDGSLNGRQLGTLVGLARA